MKLAIIVPTGSKADALAGHLLSGSQGSMIGELLGRNGIGWESVRVLSMLPFPQYAAPCNDAEGMERWLDGFGWSEVVAVEPDACVSDGETRPLPPINGSAGAEAMTAESKGHAKVSPARTGGLIPPTADISEGESKDVSRESIAPPRNLKPSATIEQLSGPSAVAEQSPVQAEGESTLSGRGKSPVLKPSSILQGGIQSLRDALFNYSPTMILALGSAALHVLKRGNVAPSRKKGSYVWPDSIVDWRGSLFVSALEIRCPECSHDDWKVLHPEPDAYCKRCDNEGVLAEWKCVASFHPTWVQRDGGLSAYQRVDMAKCAAELKAGPELVLPVRKDYICLPY